jgi:hypothetical protein
MLQLGRRSEGDVDYEAKGDLEAHITCAFVADMIHDLITRLTNARGGWGLDDVPLTEVRSFLDRFRATAFIASLSDEPDRHLDGDLEMVQDTFRSSPITR